MKTTIYALWMGNRWNIFDIKTHQYKGFVENKNSLELILSENNWNLYEGGEKTTNLVVYRRE